MKKSELLVRRRSHKHILPNEKKTTFIKLDFNPVVFYRANGVI